jgi:hypothetical protein
MAHFALPGGETTRIVLHSTMVSIITVLVVHFPFSSSIKTTAESLVFFLVA